MSLVFTFPDFVDIVVDMEMSNIEMMRFGVSCPFFASYSERYFEILMDEFVSDYQSIGPNREIIELKVSISRFLKNGIF